MSNILRDMRKGKKGNASMKLNPTMYVNGGNVISHVAQGILRNSRHIKKDHVIWKPEEDRRGMDGQRAGNTLTSGGVFGSTDTSDTSIGL